MFEKNVVVNSENGFHTRPAAQFVKLAKTYNSDVVVMFNDKKANGKSLFKLQTLGIVQGAQINIRAEGSDEENAIRSLCEFIQEM